MKVVNITNASISAVFADIQTARRMQVSVSPGVSYMRDGLRLVKSSKLLYSYTPSSIHKFDSITEATQALIATPADFGLGAIIQLKQENTTLVVVNPKHAHAIFGSKGLSVVSSPVDLAVAAFTLRGMLPIEMYEADSQEEAEEYSLNNPYAVVYY